MSTPAVHPVDLYHYNTGWCEGPECYVATCAEFQGVTAQAATPEKALALLKAAVRSIVDGMLQCGEGADIPEPLIAPPFEDAT